MLPLAVSSWAYTGEEKTKVEQFEGAAICLCYEGEGRDPEGIVQQVPQS